VDDLVGAFVATVRVIAALLLTFFVPGWLLVNTLYPRKGELDREYDALYRITLGIVLSIAITVLWGFALNSLGVNPSTGLGYVQTPEIAAGLLGLSAIFFIVGWFRGAYPWMARLHPSLARAPKPSSSDLFASEQAKDHRVRLRLEELANKREKLRRIIKECERRMRLQSTDARSHYEEQRDRARADLKKVETELRTLETERAAELYG
jgi:Protein of unknown function (DUF1616)